jgi:hypothetical protein
MLLQAIAFFQYNWKGLRNHLREPLRMQYRVGLHGGKKVSLAELTPAEQDKILLTRIHEGNEQAIAALLAFLSP